ncbi:MAG: hypothetical protein D5R97_09360, partial [Candidatus Syntrophonatronum acetioxidans]
IAPNYSQVNRTFKTMEDLLRYSSCNEILASWPLTIDVLMGLTKSFSISVNSLNNFEVNVNLIIDEPRGEMHFNEDGESLKKEFLYH